MSQLEDLLQQCTVKLTLPDRLGWGTGFFVAPEWILTCAHVVQEAKGQPVQVRWQKRELEAVVGRSLPSPYDLALLRVALPIDANPPCVYLDAEIRSRDPLYLFGYPDQDFPNGCPATFSCEGLTGDEPALIKFTLGQVRPGMSGSPMLNQRTGKVCGIVKFTRDRSLDLGGGAVPAAVVLEQFPELVEWQRSFHQVDQRWLQRSEGTIAINPVTPSSTQATLSLSAYDATTWVGRDELITTLTQKLQNGCRILALTGITGIGKTALAERLVVEISGKGVPFHRLNFDDRGQGGDFLSGALTLLPKLGETITTEDQKDPHTALRHLLQPLRQKPFLVQIDSLEMLLQGDEQTGWNAFTDPLWVDFFQQLLAGDICQSQLLLTSQALSEELEEIGARYPRYWHRQDLYGLSELEQLQLFEKYGLKLDGLGAEILKQFVEMYQGHPLVMQVIAKDILDKPFNGNVQQYWQRYQAEFNELDREHQQKGSSPRALQLRVKQRVEQSLQRLPEDARRMLCRSSVYRRPIPEEFWLAIMEELSEDQRWTALELLRSHNLAEQELRGDGVLLLRQHNLVKSVARKLLKTDEAVWREAERTAAQVWLKEYKPEPSASNLEKLRGKLEAFHHYCEAEEWEAAKELFFDQEVDSKLLRWGYSQELLSLSKRLLGKLDVLVDEQCETGIGNAYWSMGMRPQAIEHFQRSLAIARAIGDRGSEGNALGNLGSTYWYRGDYPQAIEHYQQSLTIAREMGSRPVEVRMLSNLGGIYRGLGNYPEAIKYCQQALLIAREFDVRYGELWALRRLGDISKDLSDYPQAIEYYQQSLTVAREIDSRGEEAWTLEDLGDTYKALEDYPQAIEYYQQSSAIAREIGNSLREGFPSLSLGVILLKLEHYPQAEQRLRTSLTIFKALGDRENEAEALLRLGELHYKAGQSDPAWDFCDRALSIASELGIPLAKECEALQALLVADAVTESSRRAD